MYCMYVVRLLLNQLTRTLASTKTLQSLEPWLSCKARKKERKSHIVAWLLAAQCPHVRNSLSGTIKFQSWCSSYNFSFSGGVVLVVVVVGVILLFWNLEKKGKKRSFEWHPIEIGLSRRKGFVSFLVLLNHGPCREGFWVP